MPDPRRRARKATRALLLALTILVLLLLAACAPAAAPTPTPTKAPPPPAATPTAKPAEKPAEKPAPTPTAAPSKPTGAPIKIGYLTPLTGPTAPLGQMESIVVFLAEEDVNKAGGINGNPLQIIRYDSPFDPRQAVTLVRKLALEDKAFAILGPFSSGEMDVAAPLANEFQIPVIGMKTTKPGFSEKHRPWEFRITVTDDILTPAVIGAFKKMNPNIKKVLIVGDTKESVTESMVKDVWPKYLKEAGYEIQGTVGYESGTTDFSAIITKIKDAKPEAIAYSGTPKANPGGFAKELYDQEVRVPVMASIHFINSPIVYQMAKQMEGWLSVSQFDFANPDPRVQDLVKRWQGKADADPNVPKPARLTVEGNAYDVVNILADIMRKAKITADTPLQEARTKIRDGFQSLKDYKGVSGNITMQPSGDATTLPRVVIARNGAWEVVK